jgi:hypothetical protein
VNHFDKPAKIRVRRRVPRDVPRLIAAVEQLADAVEALVEMTRFCSDAQRHERRRR